MTLKLDHQGPVSIVSMNRPPQNLLDIEYMDQLTELHKEADARPETRVIITASDIPGMFSNGLNPKYVVDMAPEDRVAIFESVARTLHGLFSLNTPHISKISGPAMAGGAIIGIASDFRFFDAEHGRFSFAEPKVGLPIPEAVIAVIGHCCPANHIRDVVMLAKNMDAKAAMEMGISDGAAPTDQLDALIQKQVERLVRLSPSVMSATKAAIRAKTRELTGAAMNRGLGFSKFVGDNFLGEGLRALLENRFPKFTE